MSVSVLSKVEAMVTNIESLCLCTLAGVADDNLYHVRVLREKASRVLGPEQVHGNSTDNTTFFVVGPNSLGVKDGIV